MAQLTVTLPSGAADWLRHGVPSPAAMFVVEWLTGLPLLNRHIYPSARPYPRNAHELYVVELLLEAVPEFRLRFNDMAKASAAWSNIVTNWHGLLDSLKDEAARGNQLAPLTTRKINVVATA